MWAQRLAPARADPEAPAADAARPHGWFIDAVDGEGRTAFHWAVAQRSFALADTLAAAPYHASLATADANHTTTLASAVAAQAPLPLVERIVAAAAPLGPEWINQADEAAGNTALHIAATRGNRDFVKLLLGAGANPLIQSKLGQTALHKTVPRGASSVAEDLISHVRKTDLKNTKRFVNMQDLAGDTALHHASAENNREFGEMLLRNGADRVVKNKAGLEYWQIK